MMKQKRYGPGLARMFRDKYPAILTVLVLFFAVDLQAQQNDSARYSQNNAYGTRGKRAINDSLMMVPLWESPHTGYRPGALYYRKADSAVYVWTGNQKLKISGMGGGGIDTAYSMDDSVVVIETADDVFAFVVRGVMKGNNGLSVIDNVVTLGRQLGSGTPGAELLYDTEIPLNGQRLFFTSPSGLAETSITKNGIEIFGDNVSNGLSRIKMVNLLGGSLTILKGPTGSTMDFVASQIFVRDSDGNLIFTKTPGQQPTAFHDVSGTGRYRDTLTITTMGDNDNSTRGASTEFVKRNNTTLQLKDSVLGIIYQALGFTTLADFVNRGATAAASGGNIEFSGGTNSFTQTLEYNKGTLLEQWHASGVFIPTEKTSTSYGFGLGIRSTSTSAVNVSIKFDASTGAERGKLKIYAGSNTLVKTSTDSITFNANDSIELHVDRTVDSISTWVINRTQNITSAKISYGYTFANGATVFNQNSGRFSIYSFGGAFNVSELGITSNTLKRPDILVIGDSKTAGYFSVSPYDRWAILLRKIFPNTVIQAGAADMITDALDRIDETINILPKQVLLCIGVNDIRNGVDSATIKTNYTSYVTQLEAAGIKIIHLLSLKETVLNADWFNNFIIRTWPSEYIDSKIQDCNNCLAGDGMHLNNRGNAVVADAVINSGKLQGQSSTEDNSLNSVLAKGYTSTIGPVIGTAARLGSTFSGTFSQPKFTAIDNYPSLVFQTTNSNFGGFSIVGKSSHAVPRLDRTIYGDSAAIAIVGQTYISGGSPGRTLAVFMADATRNNIPVFVVRQPDNDFQGTRSRFSVEAYENLYVGTGLSGTVNFNTPSPFGVNASSNPLKIFNLPAVTLDTGTYKLQVINPTTGDWYRTSWPTLLPSTTAGSVLFSNGTTIAQNNANFFWDNSNVRLGIGTNTPVASSLLDITSTTKGVLFPRMNTTQQNAISSPATGLWIYNTDSSAFRYYNGGAWVTVGGSGGGGGAGTVTTVGKTDANGFAFTITNPTTTPNISLTTSLTTGSVPVIGASGALTEDAVNFNYASGQLGLGTNSQASKLHLQTNSLGAYTTTTTQNSAGIILGTATAAANNAQQYGPSLVFRSNGWGTTAGTSQQVDWMLTNKATQGATASTSLAFKVSLNGGNYSEPISFRSDGVIFAGGISATGGLTGSTITAGSTSNITWSGRSIMTSPADGNIRLTNQAGTDFGILQGGGTTSSFPGWQRSGAGWIARLADNSANTTITASGLTLSGLAGTGTRLSTTSSTGVSGAITNGTDGQVMTLVSGAPTWSNAPTSGTYNPSFSNLGTGVSSVTATDSKVWWIRVGNNVTITGRVDPVFSSGSSGDTRTFSMSLPAGMTAAFTSYNDAQGVANCTWNSTRTVVVQSDPTNDIIYFTVMIGSEGFGNALGVHFTVTFTLP